MNKSIKRLSALALSFAALDVSAAQLPEIWEGGYAGVYFGAGSGSTNVSFSNTEQSVETYITPGITQVYLYNTQGSARLRGNATGYVADLFLGYNFHPSYSRYVLGVQLEGTLFSDITLKASGIENQNEVNTDTVTDSSGVTVTEYTYQSNQTVDFEENPHSMIAMVARAGYLVKPNILIYALAGATEGHFVIPSNEDPLGGTRALWQLGYAVGAGLEFKVNRNWSVLAEYRYLHYNVDRSYSNSYSDYDREIGALDITRYGSSFSQASHNNFGFNMGKIGIVYRFDPPCVA